jgi:hypothetical protein
MAHVKKSTVSLRVYGKDLIPDKISVLLGACPTSGLTMAENKAGKVGMWRLQASSREPADLDSQIQELLSQITGDLAVWQSITDKYQADIFFGLFMGRRNEAVAISAQSMAALGTRGIRMGLDIYGGIDEEPDEQPEISRR